MAHKHGGKGGGIEGIVPPTGPLTAITGLTVLVGGFVFACKNPKRAGVGMALASALAVAGGLAGGNACTSPLLLFVVMGLGFTIAEPRAKRTSTSVSASTTSTTRTAPTVTPKHPPVSTATLRDGSVIYTLYPTQRTTVRTTPKGK